MEKVPGNDFLEVVATEGLAHLAEHLYVQKFCAKQLVSRFYICDLQVDPVLEEGFRVAISQPPSLDDDSWSWWFDNQESLGSPRGALYGAQCVKSQLNKGYTISDLLMQPAGDVLGL